jgi:hypothetical protein
MAVNFKDATRGTASVSKTEGKPEKITMQQVRVELRRAIEDFDLSDPIRAWLRSLVERM